MFRNLASKLVVIAVFTAAFLCDAFRPTNTRSMKSFKMAIIDPDMPGQLAPLGFFDPLGLSVGTNERIFKRWRESEIKHGRLAMMAALGMLTAETIHPFYGGLVSGPSINHFSQVLILDRGFWLIPFLATGICEAYSIATAWAPRKETKGTVAWLKNDYVVGDLGFDPLGLSPKGGIDSQEWKDMRTKELQNGRLAMLAVAGIVAQELVDGRSVLGHIFGSV